MQENLHNVSDKEKNLSNNQDLIINASINKNSTYNPINDLSHSNTVDKGKEIYSDSNKASDIVNYDNNINSIDNYFMENVPFHIKGRSDNFTKKGFSVNLRINGEEYNFAKYGDRQTIDITTGNTKVFKKSLSEKDIYRINIMEESNKFINEKRLTYKISDKNAFTDGLLSKKDSFIKKLCEHDYLNDFYLNHSKNFKITSPRKIEIIDYLLGKGYDHLLN